MSAEPVSRKHVIVRESDCPIEQWDDERGNVQWRTLISGDRTATSGLTCGIATLPVGDALPFKLHRHSPVELYYVLHGTGLLHIDGQEYSVTTGTTAFIPQDASHALINTGDTPLRLLYVFPVDSFDEVEYVFPDRDR